jgi:hypothetical protein
MYAEPHRITQNELKDLFRDLELLASRLQQWHILDDNVKVSAFRSRQKRLAQFFKKEGNLVACNDGDGLMAAQNINYKPEEWRLFIDLSKSSLKAVVLHNGKVLSSIPVGYAVNMKE